MKRKQPAYVSLRSLLSSGLALASLSAGSLLVGDAHAVGTRHFVIESGADFKKGELEGAAVDSTGFLHAGLDFGTIEIPEADSVWTTLEHEGTLLLGTGNEAKVFEVKAGKASLLASVEDSLAVTSIVRAFDKTIVGVMPGGKLYELSQGKLKEFVELKDSEHIWALSYDPKAKALFAATGPEGKVYRITADGTAQVYFDSPASHLVSVSAESGKVYVGSSGEARLYEVTGPGRARVVQDFSSTEVRDIAVGKDGSVYAIVNELGDGPRSDSVSKVSPKTPSRGTAGKGKGTLYLFHPGGQPEELYASSDEHFVSLELDSQGRPVVGTGAEGQVIRVESDHNHAVIANTSERQITSVIRAEKGGWLVANDPVVVHPIEGVGGQDALWTSEVLDAGLRAKFGKIDWDVEGKVEISTRSGDTKKPDETWTDWSKPITRRATVPSLSGRYLQVRARLIDGDKAKVRRIDIPFVTDNLRPVITRVKAKSTAQTEGSNGISSSGGPLSDKASSTINLSWEVDNVDDDTLRFRVDYRLISESQWVDALKPGEVLTNKSWEWETKDLPEGRYRVRVQASDELSNAPARVLSHQLTSEVILVDNTAPKLSGLRVTGRKVEGTASDGIGPVRRIELRLAGEGEWTPLDPKDGIFDDAKEDFEMDVSTIVPTSGGLVTVRVFDTAGNVEVAHVRIAAAP